MPRQLRIGLAALLLLITGCRNLTAGPPIPTESAGSPAILVTVAPLPTLYPTSTGIVPQQPAPVVENGGASKPAPLTSTPIDFNKPVLTAHLRIPAISYDRRLTGTIGGSLTLEDLAAGEKIISANQGRALAEISGALQQLTLESLPEGCDRCTAFQYELAAEGVLAEGWLRDSILLASLELFFDRGLGPHFPPNTIIGLHRSASGYNIAQTTAVLADGGLWQWQSPDDLVASETVAPPSLLESAGRQPIRFWEDNYITDCPYYPLETLFLRTSTEVKVVTLKCPGLAIPSTMAPFYLSVNALTEKLLADERNLPFPEELLPLAAAIYYMRPDRAAIRLYPDGRVSAVAADGMVRDTTRDPEWVDQLVEGLTGGGVIPRGVSVVSGQDPAEYEELLIVRGRLGVYELPWTDRVGQGLLPEVIELEQLLYELVGPLAATGPNVAETAPISPALPLSATISATAAP